MVEISIFKKCFKFIQNACQSTKSGSEVPGYTPGPFQTDMRDIKLILTKSKKKLVFDFFGHPIAKFSKNILIKSYMMVTKNSMFST